MYIFIYNKKNKNEKIFLPDGTMKEEREPRYLMSNILDTSPIKWTGKLFPKKKIYRTKKVVAKPMETF